MASFKMFNMSVCAAVLLGWGCLAAGSQPAAVAVRPSLESFIPAAKEARPPYRVDLSQAYVDGAARDTYRLEEGALHLPAGPGPSMIRIPLDIPSRNYNALEVRMKRDRGDICGYKFLTDAQSDPEALPWNHGMVVSDNAMRTYTFALAPPQTHGWSGHIRALLFVPSPEPANTVLESLAFVYQVPEGPSRITLDTETRLAYEESGPNWVLTVPEEARLEVWLGVLSESADPSASADVRFVARLLRPSGETVHLVNQTVDGKQGGETGCWTPVYADLSAYAGEDATIQFAATAVDKTGVRAYWGSPVVRGEAGGDARAPVILISNDTLRADHLSCYGYNRETTPFFDAFAEEAVLFENAVSEEPVTLPAHMTMLTGLHPKHHKVTPTTNLDETVVTLPEVLAGAGYATAGFTGHGPLLSPARGFAKGFDVYSTPETFRNIYVTRDRVNAWLDQPRIGPFFLFFHNYDIHSKFPDITPLPYFPAHAKYLHFSKAFDPPPSLEREGHENLLASAFLVAVNAGGIAPPDQIEHDYIMALYDDGIRAVDDILREFMDSLKERGIYDEALIIITADHGEAFGEHGLYIHDDLYEQNCHVPLLIKFPHGAHAGRRIRQVVSLSDLLPTILDVAGCAAPGSKDGRSLLGLINEEAWPREWINITRNHWESVRTADWKLVVDVKDGEYELFHVAQDPQETKNLYDEAPPVLASLRPALDQFHRVPRGGWHLKAVQSADAKEPIGISFFCTASGGIAGHVLVNGDMHDHVVRGDGGRAVQGMLGLPPGDEDELVVEPGDPQEQVTLHLQCGQPFLLRLGNRTIETASWQGELAPASEEAKASGSEVFPAASGITVSVWYDDFHGDAGQAVPLTKEQEEHLRALGYVE